MISSFSFLFCFLQAWVMLNLMFLSRHELLNCKKMLFSVLFCFVLFFLFFSFFLFFFKIIFTGDGSLFHQLISFSGKWDYSHLNTNYCIFIQLTQLGVRYLILTVAFVVVMSGMPNKNVPYANALHLECKYNVKI